MLQTTYFLGANSPAGFYSLYDELSQLDRLYILKGGPGCGKSTLMKRIASQARTAGLDTQLILCSADPDSLDAVILPQKRVGVVDGTAPHVIEAQCPGAVDTYVDLSRFYDHAALHPLREDLTAIKAAYKGHYRQAYRCLGAAGELRRNLTEAADSPELRVKLQKRAAGIVGRELKKGGSGDRTERRFLSAVTHKGTVRLWNTIETLADRVYALSDSHGLAHHLLSPILQAAEGGGYGAVACYDPMAPERLCHLILPELSLAFVTSTVEEPWPRRPHRHLRLDAMAEENLLQAGKPRLRFTRKVEESLTADGVACLRQAKEAHDRLEKLYNPHVDFDGVNQTADALAKEILSL